MDRLILKRVLLILALLIGGAVLLLGTYPQQTVPGRFQSFLRIPKYYGKDIIGKEIFLLPSMDEINALNTTEVLALIHKYTNTYQILCRNQLRIGTVYDGGKEVCIDEPIVPKKPCLVYSYGSANKFDFESDIIRWFGCEVHTFDPSMNNIPMNQVKNPRGCTFHRIGLSNETKVTDKGWQLQTLGKTMKDLKHENRIIDILKIDAEGAEWRSISQMIDTGDIYRVKQLQMELHFPNKGKNFTNELEALRKLYDAGFKVFNRERNVFCPMCNVFYKELGYQVSFNVEMCYVNTNFL